MLKTIFLNDAEVIQLIKELNKPAVFNQLKDQDFDLPHNTLYMIEHIYQETHDEDGNDIGAEDETAFNFTDSLWYVNFNKLNNFLFTNFGITYQYFGFIKTSVKFGQIPLNIENFEQYTSPFSLPLSHKISANLTGTDIVRTYGRPGHFVLRPRVNTYSGWNKRDLVAAIKQTGREVGLFKPAEKQYTEQEVKNHYIKITENSLDYITQNIDDLVFNTNNKIYMRDLGLPIESYVTGLMKNPYNEAYYYEEIYRRLHGTIYTINWQTFCQAGTLNNQIFQLMTDQQLKLIIDLYYQGIQPENRNQVCQELVNSTNTAVMLLQSYSNNPMGWVQFLLGRYQKYINQKYNNVVLQKRRIANQK